VSYQTNQLLLECPDRC